MQTLKITFSNCDCTDGYDINAESSSFTYDHNNAMQ